MSKNLFLTAPDKMKEAAARMSLGEDPQTWAEELVTALFDRAPFLGAYQVDPAILQQDDQAGYAYGVFEVSQRATPRILGGTVPGVTSPSPPKKLRVPFIVAQRKLKPINVLINPEDGRMYPLAQRRVENILFSPQTFSVSTIQALPGQPTISGTPVLSPEIQEQVKVGSFCELLGKVSSPAAKEKFACALLAEPDLRSGMERNGQFRAAALAYLDSPAKTAAQIEAEIRESLPVDAFLVEKTADGYRVTTACAQAYAPEVQELTGDRQAYLPDNIRKEADERGYAIRARSMPIFSDSPVPQPITESGAYSVQTKSAASVPALVFADVTTFDGRKTDEMLVKTATGYAYVSRAMGRPLSAIPAELSLKPWQELPRGEGCFITKLGIATAPVTLEFYEHRPDGTYAHFSAAYEKGKMKIAAPTEEDFGVIKLAAGLYAIHPKTLARFCPLGKREAFCENIPLAIKLAAGATLRGMVKIAHSDGEYTLEGGPVAALSSRETSFVREPRAMFNLGLLGVDPVLARTKLAEARTFGVSQVQGFRTIEGYETRMVAARQVAKEKLAGLLPIGTDYTLAKIAAALPDSRTVDAVLGLNFITPENLALFVDKLSQLEEVLHTLCELYLAAQLGVQDLPVSALERAIKAVDTITAGLELVKLKTQEPEIRA